MKALRLPRSGPVLRIAGTRATAVIRARAVIRATLVALALATFASTASCRGDTAADPFPGSVEMAVTPTPPVVGPALLVVRVHDESGEPATGAAVDVEGTMSHAGMVPIRERAEETGRGEYRVESFDFTMGGDWILQAHITLPDGTSGIHSMDVRVLSGGPP